MNVEVPEKLLFLLTQAAAYKVIYGGRDGIKSWSIARALVAITAAHPARVLCARETQRSIKDSVHLLLRDQISRMGLEHRFTITDRAITGTCGSEFMFAGLRHNVRNIKSTESIDIMWVEEAENVSEESWRIILPTIRKDHAEVWVSFNPNLETDPTYQRFVLDPPPNSIVVKTTYFDNRWLSERSRIQIEAMRERNPAEYRHVYLGETRTAVRGAVFGEELKAATDAGRIGQVSLDRTRPVDTYWDLGYGDCTAIWFAQGLPNGQIRVIDYLEDSGRTIEHYAIELQNRGYLYGTDYLPHDGVDGLIHKRLGAGSGRSPEQLLRAAGRKVRVVQKLNVATGINAARTFLPNCYFDAEKCRDGIMALRHYQWAEDDERKPKDLRIVKREPLHNWASHGADAFRTLAVALKFPEIRQDRGTQQKRIQSGSAWMAT